MMFYAPLHCHEWDTQRRYHRARQHQIAMERERERRQRQREYSRRLAQRRRAIAMQRAHEDEMRRQHHRRQAPRSIFSSGFSDPFFDFQFAGLEHPLKSRPMPCQEDEEGEEDEEDTEVDMQLDNNAESVYDSNTCEQDAATQKDKPEKEQDRMFAYMTKKIRCMRRRRKSDADFNPEALLNLAESELNWLMEHEALRCEENAQENNNELVDKEAYRKLVLAFLRVYICENILDAISRDNFPPKPEDENENEAVGETEDGDGSQYYVLDVERRRKLHRLAARLEKEFE